MISNRSKDPMGVGVGAERYGLRLVLVLCCVFLLFGFYSIGTASPTTTTTTKTTAPARTDKPADDTNSLALDNDKEKEKEKGLKKSSKEKMPSNDDLFDFPSCLFASIIVFGGALLCAGAGVGGGAFNLVAYITFLGYGPHSAVPLSKATILGVAIGSYLVMWRKRHPTADRPLIDYNTTLLMEPMTLVGTVIGVFFNVIFPEYIIVIGLVVLLSITAYKTFQKGYSQYQKENAAAAKAAVPKVEVIPLVINNNPNDEEQDEESVQDAQEGMQAASDKIVKSEKGIPYLVLLGLFFTWAVFITVMFVAGSKQKSLVGIECGSIWFWLTLFIAFIFLTIVTMIQAWRLEKIQKVKEATSYPFADGDVMWVGYKPFVFPFFCIVAGWAAGFLGVGGGLVAGPILLQLGMQPQVATGTAGFMILFTASSTTIQYSLLGLIPWMLGLWYGALAFLGAILGQIALAELIKKTGRQSWAVLLLGILEVISMFAIGGLGIKDIIEGGLDTTFKGIC